MKSCIDDSRNALSDAGQVVALHKVVIDRSGGAYGLRDFGALDSALAQPKATFGGQDLHSSLEAKAAALGFSLVISDN